MKFLNISGGGSIGANLRKKLRGDDDEPVTWSRQSGADTHPARRSDRLGPGVSDQSVSTSHAPQIDWQDDPR